MHLYLSLNFRILASVLKLLRRHGRFASVIKNCWGVLSALHGSERSLSEVDEGEVNVHQHVESPPQELESHPNQTSYMSPTKVLALSKTSSSTPNLALLIVCQLFRWRNVVIKLPGRERKEQTWQRSPQLRKESSQRIYASVASDVFDVFDVYWKKHCIPAIDEGCRRLKRTRLRLNMSD